MKNALIVSIALAVISFATTVLTYDFVSTKETSSKGPSLPTEQVASSSPTSGLNLAIDNSSSTNIVANTEIGIGSSTSMNNQKPEPESKPVLVRSETIGANIKASSTSEIKPKTNPAAEIATIIEAKKKISWGVFTGSNPSDLIEFERRVEENLDYLAYFVHWANHGGMLNTWTKSVVADKDRTLVLFWEASDYIIGGTNQPAYSYSAIIRGDHDEYIKDFAEHLKDYKGPVILVPFSELNGDWSPWSGTKNGNTPALSVEAFRYVHGFFDDVPNVSFGWAVNAFSVPNTLENQIPFYYPGDAYVDYVGVDGFNFGDPWLSFEQKFTSALTTISQYNKPAIIFSFGSAPGPEKAAWLDNALNVQLPLYPNVKAWIYFNQNKERNWLLWSDKETFKVFTDYISK